MPASPPDFGAFFADRSMGLMAVGHPGSGPAYLGAQQLPVTYSGLHGYNLIPLAVHHHHHRHLTHMVSIYLLIYISGNVILVLL